MYIRPEYGGKDSNRGLGRASSGAGKWLTLFGLLLAIGLLGLGIVVLLDSRQDAWRQAEQASNNLALALERDISRTIAVYDLSLQGAADAMRLPDLDQTSPELRHTAIFDRAATADYLGSLLVLDATGSIVADSTAIVPHRMNFAERDYFQVHRDHADAGLFISRPFRSRLRGGDPSIAISRRISKAGGEFDGIVLGSMRINYFQELFARLDVGPGGAIVLMTADGRIVARHPQRPDDLDLDLDRDRDRDRDLSSSDIALRFKAARSDQFTGVSPVEGVSRLFTYRGIGELPLLVSVGLSVDGIYQAWWRKATVIGSSLGILCVATVALSLLFRREMKLRLRAEQGLLAAAARLEVMASTDALTGLANRRAFVAGLDEAWRVATRTRSSLALLLLDADHFKSYNDVYGHPEGDRVLQAIAACIRRCASCPGALGVRYGGEEFALLLPDTDAHGALVAAECVRQAVLEGAITHQSTPAGVVSVSVGVAVARPKFGEAAELLVREADAALYEAKHAGRNRVAFAGSGEKRAVA